MSICIYTSVALIALVWTPQLQKGVNDFAHLLASGRADEVIEAERKHLLADPTDAAAYHVLCRTYAALDSWEQATRTCERAVALNPNNSNYHMWLGRTYAERAGHSNFISAMAWAKKAHAEFEKAVELSPLNVPAISDLAEFEIDAPGLLGGGVVKAAEHAQQLMSLQPALAHFLRSRIAEKRGNFALAERELREAIASSDEPAREWMNLASFYERRKRYPEMTNAIHEALAVQGRQTSVLFYAAEILFRTRQNLSRAAQLLHEYLAGIPEEDVPLFRAHYLLGNVEEKQGQSELAFRHYSAALEHAHEYAKAREKLRQFERNKNYTPGRVP